MVINSNINWFFTFYSSLSIILCLWNKPYRNVIVIVCTVFKFYCAREIVKEQSIAIKIIYVHLVDNCLLRLYCSRTESSTSCKANIFVFYIRLKVFFSHFISRISLSCMSKFSLKRNFTSVFREDRHRNIVRCVVYCVFCSSYLGAKSVFSSERAISW